MSAKQQAKQKTKNQERQHWAHQRESAQQAEGTLLATGLD